MAGDAPGIDPEEWRSSFFDETFADLVLAKTDDPDVAPTIRFLLDRLALKPGERVFDQCCGTGRLAIPLAQQGLSVVGVDLVDAYVERARAAAARLALPCEFHAADAAGFTPPERCAAAINWFTGFGFSERDEANASLLRRAYEAIVPGGRFAIDYVNVARTLNRFKDCILSRHPAERGDLLVIRETRADLVRGMLDQTWTYVRPDGTRVERRTGTKMYLPSQLGELIARAGFIDLEFFGGVRGEPLGLESPRCVIVARRPAGG